VGCVFERVGGLREGLCWAEASGRAEKDSALNMVSPFSMFVLYIICSDRLDRYRIVEIELVVFLVRAGYLDCIGRVRVDLEITR
jgi:hypothetical protein